MQRKARQVKAERVETPQKIIERVGQPGERLVVAHIESPEHPADVRPIERAILRVFQQKLDVIPIDEAVVERGQEENKSQREDQYGEREAKHRRPHAGFGGASLLAP